MAIHSCPCESLSNSGGYRTGRARLVEYEEAVTVIRAKRQRRMCVLMLGMLPLFLAAGACVREPEQKAPTVPAAKTSNSSGSENAVSHPGVASSEARLEAPPDGIKVLTDVDVPPRRIEWEAPSFEEKWDVKGYVILDVIVDSEGRVTHVDIVHGLTASIDAGIVEAVRGWKYTPGEKAGKRVEVKMRLSLRYSSVG